MIKDGYVQNTRHDELRACQVSQPGHVFTSFHTSFTRKLATKANRVIEIQQTEVWDVVFKCEVLKKPRLCYIGLLKWMWADFVHLFIYR